MDVSSGDASSKISFCPPVMCFFYVFLKLSVMTDVGVMVSITSNKIDLTSGNFTVGKLVMVGDNDHNDDDGDNLYKALLKTKAQNAVEKESPRNPVIMLDSTVTAHLT